MTKTEILLRAIERRNGMTFGEITELACLMCGLDYEERDGSGRRRYRGFWSTRLLGGPFYHSGVLHKFCEKGRDGKWRVVKQIRPPFVDPAFADPPGYYVNRRG